MPYCTPAEREFLDAWKAYDRTTGAGAARIWDAEERMKRDPCTQTPESETSSESQNPCNTNPSKSKTTTP